jgi:hypothetical protein
MGGRSLLGSNQVCIETTIQANASTPENHCEIAPTPKSSASTLYTSYPVKLSKPTERASNLSSAWFASSPYKLSLMESIKLTKLS